MLLLECSLDMAPIDSIDPKLVKKERQASIRAERVWKIGKCTKILRSSRFFLDLIKVVTIISNC
jgi:hypothetical protein